jgi:hypothetical protein
MRKAVLVVGGGALLFAPAAPGWSSVLCQKRSGAVFVRDGCKKKEKPLDLHAGGVGRAEG